MLSPVGCARLRPGTKCLLNLLPASSHLVNSRSESSAAKFFQESNHNSAAHPYLHLYPWKSLQDFANVLQQSITYQDKNIIILDKPWGVGIYQKYPAIHKKNSDLIQWAGRFGDPKFCVADALPLLSEMLGLKALVIARSLDRYESGLMVLAKSPKGVSTWNVFKTRAKTQNIPYMHYLSVCRGTPFVPDGFSKERIAIKLLEVDELGDHKVPVIETKFTKTQAVKQNMKTGVVSLRLLDVNSSLATSLIEIGTNVRKWNFVRVYAASKASFILGDVKFSSRVKEVFGVPLTISPHIAGNESYEALHHSVRKRLAVTSNKDIPLLSYLHRITLVGNKKQNTIEVFSKELPQHFEWTLVQLKLSQEKIRNFHHGNK